MLGLNSILHLVILEPHMWASFGSKYIFGWIIIIAVDVVEVLF